MKYIKTYENIKNIYRKGDFVLLYNEIGEFSLPYAKIIARYKHKPNKEPTDKYYVEILYPNTNHWSYNKNDEIHTAVINDYLIVKKLTKKEIEELELKMSANKYNL